MRDHSCSTIARAAMLLLILSGSISCVAPRRASTALDSTGAVADRGVQLRWIRIHGAGDETSPPLLRMPSPGKLRSGSGADALTLSFDVISETIPNLTLVLIHCDRFWRPTESIFIQDPIRLRSSDFEIVRTPVGVEHHDYHMELTFPTPNVLLRIEHSGNYLARIVDYYDNTKVYGETRFFAVEAKAGVDVDIYSDFYMSALTDVGQNGLKVHVESQPEIDLFGSQIRAIHLYRYGDWLNPMIASQDVGMSERRPGEVWTMWDSYFGGKSVAIFSNIPSGNEHRLLDLTDFVYYPPTSGILTTPLSDLPRQTVEAYDNNGVAINRFVPSRDNDYVYFEFRLDLGGKQAREDIFVVGTFNNWTPTAEWQLHFNDVTGLYVGRGWIKRAVHEYQYVAGTWDEDRGVLRNADPSLLETNLSSTSHPYLALVYYHDPTAGGYDRIIGVGLGLSGNFR